MSTEKLIFLGVFEVIALLVIIRMWAKRWHKRLVVRLLWSAVLFVPVFGVLFYFFLRESPDEHPYDTDTMRGSAEAFAEGGGHFF
jgi:hypothetical protein